jgi:hypothetical protein
VTYTFRAVIASITPTHLRITLGLVTLEFAIDSRDTTRYAVGDIVFISVTAERIANNA